MIIKTNRLMLTAVLPMLIISSGQCDSIAETGPYIGLGLGYSITNIDSDSIQDGLCGGSCIAYSDNEDSLGLKIFGGYLFNDYLAVEGGYVNLGKFTYTATSTTGTSDGTYKVQGGNLDLLFHLPLMDMFSLTARGGLLYSQLKEDYSNSGSYTKSSLGYKYGLGFQYDFTPAWGLRAEWEDYHLEESFAGGADVHLLSIGVVYRFGIEEEVVPEPEPVVIIKEVKVPVEPIVITSPPPPPERIVLASDALFDFDQSELVAQGKATLTELAKNIKENDHLIITGHTDDVGTEEYNLELSDRRANAVRDFLIEQGISPEQIETVAKGESEPIADNVTDEGRTANRRVDINIVTTTQQKETK